jgi:hypothetical protein
MFLRCRIHTQKNLFTKMEYFHLTFLLLCGMSEYPYKWKSV